MKHTSHLLFAAIIATPTAALAINVCTDASGKTVYQQAPCLSLEPRKENAPVAATAMTASLATETIRRFRASLSSRDATMASHFFAPSFKGSIQDAKGTAHYDRTTFAEMLTLVLNAATAYKSEAKCATPVIAEGIATVVCEVRESITILKKTSESVSSDTHKIGLTDGAAKFVSISSIQRAK